MQPDILLVDDNQDAAELLHELLDMQGHAVRVAHTGQQALALLAERPAHLFLVDQNLPDTTGSALVPLLRVAAAAHGVTRSIAIAITGMAMPGQTTLPGFDHVLGKPLDFNAFDTLLARSLARLQAGD